MMNQDFSNDSALLFEVAVQCLQFSDRLGKSESDEFENALDRYGEHRSPRLLSFSLRSNATEKRRAICLCLANSECASGFGSEQSTAAFSWNGFGSGSEKQIVHNFR